MPAPVRFSPAASASACAKDKHNTPGRRLHRTELLGNVGRFSSGLGGGCGDVDSFGLRLLVKQLQLRRRATAYPNPSAIAGIRPRKSGGADCAAWIKW
jgi:hypothetical protein